MTLFEQKQFYRDTAVNIRQKYSGSARRGLVLESRAVHAVGLRSKAGQCRGLALEGQAAPRHYGDITVSGSRW